KIYYQDFPAQVKALLTKRLPLLKVLLTKRHPFAQGTTDQETSLCSRYY
ncbi:hypothetical protein A2U01_0054987, partial [Trifolium medium]|nr:hypothetical protein [Trifolium medium]